MCMVHVPEGEVLSLIGMTDVLGNPEISPQIEGCHGQLVLHAAHFCPPGSEPRISVSHLSHAEG